MIANNLFVRKPCKQGCPDRKELTIMKSKEELNALKERIETVSKELRELTPEELEQVTGGIAQCGAVAVAIGAKLAFAGIESSPEVIKKR